MAVFDIKVFRTVIATGLDVFYSVFFKFLLEMWRRLSNKKKILFQRRRLLGAFLNYPRNVKLCRGRLWRLLGPEQQQLVNACSRSCSPVAA